MGQVQHFHFDGAGYISPRILRRFCPAVFGGETQSVMASHSQAAIRRVPGAIKSLTVTGLTVPP
jgi:hypothetical protein